jgi:beta-RFAP synthase
MPTDSLSRTAQADPLEVLVRAPARLHMGFLDLSGSLGRRFGSVGLTLEGMGVLVRARRAEQVSAAGPQAQRALEYAKAFVARLGLQAGAHLLVQEALPEHVGLGSGTQLALAVGVALVRLYDLDLSVREIATVHERGQRSGIGIGAFETGGFLLDGGRGTGDAPPPTVARVEFPAAWRVVLIFDDQLQGLHGAHEMQAFRQLPAFPDGLAAHLCRLMLMQAIPALLEQDLEPFGRSIAELQRAVGDHFAPVQGGRFSSARVAQALGWLEAQGIACLGQSSWGPTGFAIVASEDHARRLAQAGRELYPGLRFKVLAARNRGGEVHAVSAPAERLAARS